ncbi:PREDICTED: zinc finger MYM-type protein 1-like [Diuraphis noxia]|uniref:zinc finger MYM-type protein 1-like n=1 Tax=Diuraphis noxia TaxID=143948 RepID=UPI00076355F2|nr:PREDICTED: zinc finger MYM-type protein 1-like [Diuraphis noxia]
MQGQYSSVRSYVQEKNPNAIYVWCFAHVLNLVVVDTCDKCSSVRNFFGEVQKTPCGIKNFSTTRWTSHGRALSVINKKYLAFIKTLEELINSTDRETSSTASNLYRIMTSFKFILNLFLMENIFSHTTPLSIYLQSSSIDFIQAITMVDVCAKKLFDLRNEQSFNDLITKTKSFVNEIGLVECDLPNIRSRRRKLLPGEVVSDEVMTNSYDQFKIEVFYVVWDQVNTSIISRFEGARGILSNLSLLTFDRLKSTSEGTEISDDHFIAIRTNNELIIESENENTPDSDSPDEMDDEEVIRKKLSATEILKMLCSYNLVAAFPNLFLLYKYLCTIPTTSAASERSFSKDIVLNPEEIVNKYAFTSSVLLKELLFK